MLRTSLLSLLLLVSLATSTSIIRRKLSRRQADSSHCQAIEGFDCKCSHYRVTCTADRAFNSPITVSENEKHKYQSVELVISAEQDIQVDDRTFEPVKELYKPDADNAEFRLKFERFTALRLASPGLLNRVFPDTFPSNARKHLALEIYNPTVPPNENAHLFQNLQADSLELYALYPFQGTFQQMFDGANIKYLRLSGGDIRSDLSQPFTGNIHRLELAKQAETLSVGEFPVYPAHELIINAFYISKFNNEHPPNYDNLRELRVHSQENIPANAFRQYPHINTLSVHTEKDIDPHAFDGLDHLEKLIIKDSKTTKENLDNLPNVKELETNVEKLDANLQCKLLEKLASGQVAVQAIPNGRECTCVSAYLDTAAGRAACDAQDCDRSSCAVIKSNYDPATRQFTPPPAIRRADGSDALRPRDNQFYSAPFQVSQKDQEKLSQGAPAPAQPAADVDEDDDNRRPNDDGPSEWNPDRPNEPHDDFRTTNVPGDDGANVDVDDKSADGAVDGHAGNGTETSAPGKRRMSWLPIIIIIAAIVALLLIGLLFLLLRKRRAAKGYNAAPTKDSRPETGVQT